jgi:hypothetical protein
MSGRFLAAGDAVSEALSDFAALEIGEANDIDELVRSLAQWIGDISYTIFRHADQLSETAIWGYVYQEFYEAGRAVAASADEVSDLTEFSLIRR